jgi:hypothetical protein
MRCRHDAQRCWLPKTPNDSPPAGWGQGSESTRNVNQGVNMKFKSLGTVAAAVACMGMMLPPAALAEAPVAGNNDIALRHGGVLVGQVVDQQGVAKAGTPVSIHYGKQEVARTTTDANGVFAAKGLRGGQYELLTLDGVSVCRLWAPDTAPPTARSAALVVSGNDVVRGQYMGSWIDWMKAHPYITAGVVATAIAVPVAVAASDNDEGS